MKIIKIVLLLIVLVIILAVVLLHRQNQKPNILLGLENGKLREIPLSPNCISTQTEQTEKLVEPMAYKDDLEETKTAIKKAFEAYGDIEIIEETDQYIYAVATTGVMKFHDDIEVYFDDEMHLVQFRSASRAGYSDMGLNLERYKAIVDYYKAY